MLVIIGDLHLSDNSLSQSVDAGACRVLQNKLLELATLASWREDGCYRPLDGIDVVLLGDTLDIIQSDYWRKNQVRPWPDPYSRKTIDAVSNITDRILKANGEFAQALRELSKISIAAKTPSAHLAENSVDSQAVIVIPLRVHYMVGETDWPLHLPGAGYDLVRHKVMQTLGLANAFDRPFPIRQHECAELNQTLSTHQVYAHHGNMHDPISQFADQRRPSFANVLSIELVQRFVMEAIESAGKGLPAALASRLLELFDCRPIQNAAEHLSGLLKESIRSPSLLRKFCENWNGAVVDALQIYAQQHAASGSNSELVNQLAGLLCIQTRASEVSNSVSTAAGFTRESLREHALAEPALQNGLARYVIYGHSHHYDYCALPAMKTKDGAVERAYFNCGTWRPSFPAQMNAGKPFAFRPQQNISILVFYKDDERCGRPYETWQGTLAPPRHAEKAVIIRKAENSFRAVRSIVKASVMSGPHFLNRADAKPMNYSG